MEEDLLLELEALHASVPETTSDSLRVIKGDDTLHVSASVIPNMTVREVKFFHASGQDVSLGALPPLEVSVDISPSYPSMGPVVIRGSWVSEASSATLGAVLTAKLEEESCGGPWLWLLFDQVTNLLDVWSELSAKDDALKGLLTLVGPQRDVLEVATHCHFSCCSSLTPCALILLRFGWVFMTNCPGRS